MVVTTMMTTRPSPSAYHFRWSLNNVLFRFCFFLACVALFVQSFGMKRSYSRLVATTTITTTTQLNMVPRKPKTNIQVPLLDVLDGSDYKDKIVTPLPSAHLPDEVATPFLYGMQLDRPIHKLLLEEAISSVGGSAGIINLDDGPRSSPMYGHLVKKGEVDEENPLIGAIGCTGEILVNAPSAEIDLQNEEGQRVSNADTSSGESPNTVLCRGGYRFIVKEVIKTFPYPVALIDELMDDDTTDDNDETKIAGQEAGDNDEEDEDEDDDDDDEYSSMSGSELLQRTMNGIQTLITQKLDESDNAQQMSLLEQSILEDTGLPIVDPSSVQRYKAEEIAAVWDVFQSSLIDMDILPEDRKYSIAFLAAELADMDNTVRQQILITTNSHQRLRLVLQTLDEFNGMAQARKLATSITDKADDDDRDLKVGEPELPPWSKSIHKGQRIEYFWSEIDGWLCGEVIEDPVKIIDELLITVEFDDGEVHKLPLTPDDKVRWRPG